MQKDVPQGETSIYPTSKIDFSPINTRLFPQFVDAIALQMCLEQMEPCEKDLEATSQRQAWCNLVLSVKIPMDEMIGKSTTEDKVRVGEKTGLILIQCRYRLFILFCFYVFAVVVLPTASRSVITADAGSFKGATSRYFVPVFALNKIIVKLKETTTYTHRKIEKY